jgi:MFS family permease
LQLQDVQRLSPAAAGLVLLPFSVCAAAGSAVSGRLPGRPAALISGGVALVAAGCAVAAARPTVTTLATWGVLCGLGIGVASVAATTLGASAVGDADRGIAAGLLNTAAQVGTALGIAALVLVAGAGSHRLAFAVAGAACLAGAVALLQLGDREREAPGVDRPGRLAQEDAGARG